MPVYNHFVYMTVIRVCVCSAVLFTGLASTPSGKQGILDEGAIPHIVCLLGSRFPRVVSAAVSTVRNLSAQDDMTVYMALLKAGASNMLTHVVGSKTGMYNNTAAVAIPGLVAAGM